MAVFIFILWSIFVVFWNMRGNGFLAWLFGTITDIIIGGVVIALVSWAFTYLFG